MGIAAGRMASPQSILVSELERRGVLESKIAITLCNNTILSVGCPPRFCIPQIQPCDSPGRIVIYYVVFVIALLLTKPFDCF